jgi:ketosteroid isomerase-like protein
VCANPVRTSGLRDAGAEPLRPAWRAVVLAALLLAWLARPAAADTLAEEIGRAETRFAAALVGDWQALEELLGDDFIYNTAEGTTLGKTALIAYLQSGAVQVGAVELEQTRVSAHGDTALSTGLARVRAQRDGEERTIVSRFLHVWAREGAQWKLLARQVTYLKQAPAAAR